VARTERFLVIGYVQGVGFRAFAAHEARRLGLVGWVRNRGADQVEAVLQGDSEALEAFAQLARRGPWRAEVLNLEREPADPALLRLAGDARGCAVLPSV